jgi:hypothetical protein
MPGLIVPIAFKAARDQWSKAFAWEASPNRGSLKRHPHLWHSRAGGGAVHSIRSGLMHWTMSAKKDRRLNEGPQRRRDFN